jgi:hypothetical protein
MWQFDMSTYFYPTRGIKFGRFYIWKDSTWLQHGDGRKIRHFTEDIKRPFTNLGEFFKSLNAYLRLNRAGFRISYSERKYTDLNIYRFWWKDQAISDMADIDYISDDDSWHTMFNGSSKLLDGGKNAIKF